MPEATPTGAVDVHSEILSILNKSKTEATPKEPEAQKDAPKSVEDESGSDDAPPREPEKEAEAEEEQQGLELSAVAAVFGVDESMLDVGKDGKVFVKTKIDGQEGAATFNDLLKSYQLEGHLNKKNMEVAEMRKALEAERNAFQQNAQAELQRVGNALQIAQIELNADFQNVNWAELESVNPVEYTRMRLKFQDRQNRIQAAGQFLSQYTLQQREALVQQESEKLFAKIPEWRDRKAFETARTEMINELADYGFNAQEVMSAADHRILLMARDALAYRKLRASQPEVKKKVVQAPKMIKPGVPAEPAGADAKISQLKAKVNDGDSLREYLIKSGVAGRK